MVKIRCFLESILEIVAVELGSWKVRVLIKGIVEDEWLGES